MIGHSANLHVMEKCELPSIDCLLICSQLWQTGHIVHMEDSRIQHALVQTAERWMP